MLTGSSTILRLPLTALGLTGNLNGNPTSILYVKHTYVIRSRLISIAIR